MTKLVNTCEHKNKIPLSITEIITDDNGNGTHTGKFKCLDCNTEFENTENCTYVMGVCRYCEYRNYDYSADPHFIVNPDTQELELSPLLDDEENEIELRFIKGSHNSKRMTFELPRYIEDHDMSLCNKIRVHFINISEEDSEIREEGVYEVDDLQILKTDNKPDRVVCTWLVSQNATKHVGTLNFIISFAVIYGSKLEYSWNTGTYINIPVRESYDNGEYVAMKYTDILEEWHQKLIDDSTSGVNAIITQMNDAVDIIRYEKQNALDDISNGKDTATENIGYEKQLAIEKIKSEEAASIGNINNEKDKTLDKIEELFGSVGGIVESVDKPTDTRIKAWLVDLPEEEQENFDLLLKEDLNPPKSSHEFNEDDLPTDIYYKVIEPEWVNMVVVTDKSKSFEVSAVSYAAEEELKYAFNQYNGCTIPANSYYLWFERQYNPQEEYPTKSPLYDYTEYVEKTMCDSNGKIIYAVSHAFSDGMSETIEWVGRVTYLRYEDGSPVEAPLTLYPAEIIECYDFENLQFTTEADGNTLLGDVYSYVDEWGNRCYTLYPDYTPNIKEGTSAISLAVSDPEDMLYSIKLEALFNGDYKYSLGNKDFSFIGGKDVVANGDGSYASGKDIFVTGAGAHGLGNGNFIRANTGNAIGLNNKVTGRHAVAFNEGNKACGYATFVIGDHNGVYGWYDAAGGWGNKSFGKFNYTFGGANISKGEYAVNFGSYNEVEGLYNLAHGYHNNINGKFNIINGQKSNIIGDYNNIAGIHTITGNGNMVNGDRQTIDGLYNVVNGYTHTINGKYNIIDGHTHTINGDYNTVNGMRNTIESLYNAVFGIDNSIVATSHYNLINGDKNKITVQNSARNSITGYNNIIEAPNGYCIIVGRDNIVKTAYGNAFGQGLIVDGGYGNQLVVGKFNEVDRYARVIIGNGKSDSERSNAVVVRNDGTIIQKSPNGTKYAISVNDDGTLSTKKVTY
jgi:hypothetical protein